MSVTTSNPFSYRSRITDPAALFDRERERDLLRLYLTKDMCCQVAGPRGIGKSSLLFNLQTFAHEWDNAFAVAYVDLQDPHCHTVAGFADTARAAWEDRLHNLSQQEFTKKTWAVWDDRPVSPSLLDLAERLEVWRKQRRRPVLCLDGFEELMRHPKEFTPDFFLDLRALAQAGMCIVTASRQPLNELLPHPSLNPTSPFFNIFNPLPLGPFSEADASDFVTLHRPGVPPFKPDEKAAILAFAKGYPLALQVACFHVLQAKESGESLAAAMQKAEDEMKAYLPVS